MIMTTVDFYPVAPWCNRDNKWKASNRALGEWIRCKRPALGPALAIAGEIRRQLESIFPLLDEICRVSCPWCPEPCCIVNKVWIDFQDLLFLHLLDLQIPPTQLNTADEDTCRYLTHRGCRLPRIIRPWACTLHTCPTQVQCLDKMSLAVQSEYHSAIRSIKKCRFDMTDAVNPNIA